jgi:8-oxo-dGTP diphosphatase
MNHYVPESDAERAFLAAYRHRNYPRPAVTADVVAFTWREGSLELLLIQRGIYPHRGGWALPGGFVDVGDAFDDQGEDLDTAAARELHEECGVAPGSVELHQLGAFGAPCRDPRIRLITVAYLALLPPELAATARAGDDAAHAEWVALSRLAGLELAFDHADIVETAIARLRHDAEHGPVLRPLLAERFTWGELRALHGALWGARFDERRFRVIAGRLRADGVMRQLPGRPIRYGML